ncbi:MAG: hypothetical protein ISS17_09650 [Bacteroidales bacterium]|nr:hypothetical protein [Bacteroidales bacterium]
MKSNLESYIKKNRGGLDLDSPNDELVWKNISLELSVELYRELHQIDIQYDAYLADLQEMGENPKSESSCFP